MTILVTIAFLNCALGLVIYFQGKRNLVSKWFSVFAFSLAVWSFGMMMYARDPFVEQAVYDWSILLHLAGSLVAMSFLFFTLYYPEAKTDVKTYWQLILFLPLLVIFYFLFIDQQIIIGINNLPNNRQLVYGAYYPFYFMHFFLYMGIGLFHLFIKSYRYTEKLKRQQIKIIFWGVLIPLVFAGIINMVLAALGNFTYAWTGPIFLLIVVCFITYAIVKLQFLDLKVVAAEIFAVLLSLISLVEIFSANSVGEIVGRIIIFIITLVFAIFLVRAVLQEVRRREEMEILTMRLQKTTKQLKNANKKLEQLDQAKSEFLSIASHQLRTPLTVIKGYISMILEGSFGRVPKIIRLNLEKVYASSERLISLVESLLNISRIEAGRLELDVKPTNIAVIAQSLVNDFKFKAQEKKLDLEYYSDGKIPKVMADPIKIKEVISNLIDNAIKYTEKGEIIVDLHVESQSVVVSCQDSGHGIDPEDLPKLFNKFVRGKGMMQIHTEGTGLGLYFARKLIENMGGRIWAESPGLNQGSKFSFSLPLADKTKAKKIKI